MIVRHPPEGSRCIVVILLRDESKGFSYTLRYFLSSSLFIFPASFAAAIIAASVGSPQSADKQLLHSAAAERRNPPSLLWAASLPFIPDKA